MNEDVENLYQRLKEEAEERGYHLNPDTSFTKDLVSSLIINENRYGYPSCPCRLATGVKEKDMDIICPCDYRDADLNEYGSCYCALYVSDEVIDNKKTIGAIPERRGSERQVSSVIHVWRCRVCGYLCAREQPPNICPICKAKKERFEAFEKGPIH